MSDETFEQLEAEEQAGIAKRRAMLIAAETRRVANASRRFALETQQRATDAMLLRIGASNVTPLPMRRFWRGRRPNV